MTLHTRSKTGVIGGRITDAASETSPLLDHAVSRTNSEHGATVSEVSTIIDTQSDEEQAIGLSPNDQEGSQLSSVAIWRIICILLIGTLPLRSPDNWLWDVRWTPLTTSRSHQLYSFPMLMDAWSWQLTRPSRPSSMPWSRPVGSSRRLRWQVQLHNRV